MGREESSYSKEDRSPEMVGSWRFDGRVADDAGRRRKQRRGGFARAVISRRACFWRTSDRHVDPTMGRRLLRLFIELKQNPAPRVVFATMNDVMAHMNDTAGGGLVLCHQDGTYSIE